MSTTERLKNLLRRRARQEQAVPFSPSASSTALDTLSEDNEVTAFDAHVPVANDPLRSRDSIISDGSSLMLYSPLQPSQELAVEIAVSEWREWRPDSFENLFEFDSDRRESVDGQLVDYPPSPEEQKPTVNSTRQFKVWLPSRTQLSFQFLWWGYRIFLPPPVLAVLNNRRLESAKRAAILATAIQWLLNHIPVQTLPSQFLPFTTLLSGLPSVTGQVGALLAWSWSAVQSFDEGYGVILTATWVLPIILIPSTWRPDPNDSKADEILSDNPSCSVRIVASKSTP